MFTYGNKNWGKEPKPGELNQRIEIISPINETNENGYPEMRDETFRKCWAKVIQSGDSTNAEANANAQSTTIYFGIRYIEGVKPGMVVLFDGGRYEIVAVGGFDFRKRFLGMKTVQTGVMGL